MILGRNQRRIVNLPSVDHMKPFGPTDHMGPEPIIEAKVWEDVIPPAMVYSCLILPLLVNPVESILGDLKSPPQCFFNQKQRGRLPRELLGNVPTQTTGYEPFCQNTGCPQEANLWLAGWLVAACLLQRLPTWWWDAEEETLRYSVLSEMGLSPLSRPYSANPQVDPKTHIGTGTVELFFVMILTTP